MVNILAFEGKEPRIAEGAYVAPTAALIGDVVVEDGASVWFGAVLRGDFNRIVIGVGTSVQDNVVIHTNEGLPTVIGENVTVATSRCWRAAPSRTRRLIRMGSIALNRASVGSGAMLAAGSVVVEDSEIPSGVLAAGAPARVKKELGGNSAEWVEMAAREYQALRLKYMGGSR